MSGSAPAACGSPRAARSPGGRHPAATPTGAQATALPASQCSPIYSAPGVRPRYLVASDLPLGSVSILHDASAQLEQAILFALPERGFRAGRFTIGYQTCDDYNCAGRAGGDAHDPIEMDGGTVFHFVTDGFDAAYAQACETAGDGGVDIAGGASTVRQALIAGVVDELTLDLAPVLLGSGERIFDGVESFGLEPVEVLHSPLATHIRYRRAG